MFDYLFSYYYIYIYIFVILIYLNFNKKLYIQKQIVWLFFFTTLVLLDGLRWETGNDWNAYLDNYLNCFVWTNDRLEIGYQFLNQLIYYLFGDNYTTFLLITAAIYYYLICNSVNKYSNMPLVAIFLFYCGYLAFMGTNRQLLAFSICFYSVRFVLDKKYVHFFLSIFFASLLHNSAIVFLLIVLLNRMFDFKIYVLGLIVAVAFSLFRLVDVFFLSIIVQFGGLFLVDRLGDYFGNEAKNLESFSYIMMLIPLLRRTFVIVLAYIMRDRLSEINRYFVIMFNMYYLFLLVYLFFFGSQLQILVSRLSVYLMICEFVLIGEFIYIFRKKVPAFLIVFCLSIYGALFVNKALDESGEKFSSNLFYPYKSIFINAEFKRTMY